MKLYDALKAGRTNIFSNYWDYLYGKELVSEHDGIKTITQMLPIAFRTSEEKLRDWTIYGNDNVGKNKFETPNISETWYTVNWSVENGVLKGVGTYGDSAAHTRPRLQGQLPAGSYILSGSPDYTTTGIRLQIGTCTDSQGNNFAILGYDGGSGFSFTLQADSWVSVRVWTNATLYQQAIDVSIPIMIRPADTSADFEPYQIGIGQRTNNGYIVPLIVNGHNVNIPIGNAPLTEGETVSRISTGIDIDTRTAGSGGNVINSALYNQPIMSITYKKK